MKLDLTLDIFMVRMNTKQTYKYLRLRSPLKVETERNLRRFPSNILKKSQRKIPLKTFCLFYLSWQDPNESYYKLNNELNISISNQLRYAFKCITVVYFHSVYFL